MRKSRRFSPLAQVVALLGSLVMLAACGVNPQAPGGVAAPTASPVAPGGAPYPAPTAAGAYPAPDAPTAYPPPLGAAPQPDPGASAAAPTRPPMEATPVGGGSGAPGLPPGFTSGEVPADRAAGALADLLQRTGAAATEVTVVSAQSIEWPDGALGCPRPGMAYPQVITPGYKLVLAVGGREYAYHASERGDFFLCE